MTSARFPARTAIAIATATILTLTSCGGDDDTAETPDAPAAAATDAPPAATDAPAAAATTDATITIAGFAFSGVAEVAVGTTVIITNDDSTPHTWSADDGAFNSDAIAPGESFEFTFTEAGTFAYHCNFHPSMTATITVTG